jgi:hypothetical protein
MRIKKGKTTSGNEYTAYKDSNGTKNTSVKRGNRTIMKTDMLPFGEKRKTPARFEIKAGKTPGGRSYRIEKNLKTGTTNTEVRSPRDETSDNGIRYRKTTVTRGSNPRKTKFGGGNTMKRIDSGPTKPFTGNKNEKVNSNGEPRKRK